MNSLLKYKPMEYVSLTNLNSISDKYWLQIKYDGVRFIYHNGVMFSRALIEFPNPILQKLATCLSSSLNPSYIYEGELIANNFEDVIKCVTSHEAALPDNLKLIFFDLYNPDNPYMTYEERHKLVEAQTFSLRYCEIARTYEGNLQNLAYLLSAPIEGIMIKKRDAIYKFGKTSFTDDIAYKLVKYRTSEAKILDILPRCKNLAESEYNNVGKLKKNKLKENLIPLEIMGALKVEDYHTKKVFCIGTGFSQELALKIWENKEDYLGKYVTYQYKKHSVKEAMPIGISFKSFRELKNGVFI